MRPRFVFPVLTVILLAGGGLWWYGQRSVPSSGIAGSGSMPAVGNKGRWSPLFDPAVPAGQRLRLAQELDSSLSLAAFTAWAESLDSGSGGGKQETQILVFNEVVEQFRRRGIHRDSLGSALAGWLANANLHPTLRDYAVQHLGLWLTGGTSGQPGETDLRRRDEQLGALCRVVGDPAVRQNSLPGTALLVLADMESRDPALMATQWKALDASLASLLQEDGTPAILRVSAIQAAMAPSPAPL